MNILLWIALIGVIVFLLGLAYSKFSSSASKQPATKTISPAIAPSSTSPVEAKANAPKNTNIRGAVIVEKSAPDIQPITVQKMTEEKPAPVKPSASVSKITPAAEPVGPSHSKPNNTVEINAAEKPAAKSTTPEAPAPAIEPVRLKKPRNDKADDLTQITGIGKAIQNKLFSAGIFHYDQLTGLSAVQTTWIDTVIGFTGRYERENWGVQAKKLAAKSNTAPAEAPKRVAKVAAKAPATKTKTASKPKAKTVKKTPTTR